METFLNMRFGETTSRLQTIGSSSSPLLRTVGRSEYLGTQLGATAFENSQMKRRRELRLDLAPSS
jgi:hypothetical protein